MLLDRAVPSCSPRDPSSFSVALALRRLPFLALTCTMTASESEELLICASASLRRRRSSSASTSSSLELAVDVVLPLHRLPSCAIPRMCTEGGEELLRDSLSYIAGPETGTRADAGMSTCGAEQPPEKAGWRCQHDPLRARIAARHAHTRTRIRTCTQTRTCARTLRTRRRQAQMPTFERGMPIRSLDGEQGRERLLRPGARRFVLRASAAPNSWSRELCRLPDSCQRHRACPARACGGLLTSGN